MMHHCCIHNIPMGEMMLLSNSHFVTRQLQQFSGCSQWTECVTIYCNRLKTEKQHAMYRLMHVTVRNKKKKFIKKQFSLLTYAAI